MNPTLELVMLHCPTRVHDPSSQSEFELRCLFASPAAFQGYQQLAKRLETLDVNAEGCG